MGMFSNEMCEMKQGRVEMKEMTPSTMELVLDYIYTGEVKLAEDTVQNLLSAANMLQLIMLRDVCEEFMMDNVTAANCVGVYFFAKAHECEKLASKSRDMMYSRFSELCREEEFLMLPHDKLIQLIQDDAVDVDKEETIYEACLAWLQYDLASRKRHLVDVLKHVRFANISTYYFCDVVDTSTLLKEFDEIQEILSLVKYRHILRDRQCETDLNLVPRRGMSYERDILIMANPHHDDYVKRYCAMELLVPSTGEIKYLCKLPRSVYMPGACVTGDNQIYLAGGAIRNPDYREPLVSEDVIPDLFLFDKTFKSWQVKSKMNFARAQFALVLVDGLIYAVGGHNDSGLLDVVECYSPTENKWTIVSPLPTKLRSMTAVSFRGKLYCFGGETSSEITNAAYRYDVNEDRWVELPSMMKARALAGSAVYKNNIYVIGGNTAVSMKWKNDLLPEHCTNTVEVFDPEANSWHFGPEMRNSVCGAGVVKYGGTVTAVGGEDRECWMAGLFMLRNENGKDVWSGCQELPDIMSTFACGVANFDKSFFQEAAPS